MTDVDYSHQKKNTSLKTHGSEIVWKKDAGATVLRQKRKSPSVSGAPFIRALSFPSHSPLPPHSLPQRGNSSCMQVISVCGDGRSAPIGSLDSYADVKIAGCVCQKGHCAGGCHLRDVTAANESSTGAHRSTFNVSSWRIPHTLKD